MEADFTLHNRGSESLKVFQISDVFFVPEVQNRLLPLVNVKGFEEKSHSTAPGDCIVTTCYLLCMPLLRQFQAQEQAQSKQEEEKAFSGHLTLADARLK